MKNAVSAALLAGGKSSRMGRDKCLIEVDGIALWQRQLTLLQEIASDVMVVAPARPQWCPENQRWVEDSISGCGPLGGLAAALANAAHERVVVLAVDLPAMTSDYLEMLIARTTDACGIAPVIDDLFQPLSAIYPRAALAAAAAHLKEPDKSLQRLLRQLVAGKKMKSLSATSESLPLFRNLNTGAD